MYTVAGTFFTTNGNGAHSSPFHTSTSPALARYCLAGAAAVPLAVPLAILLLAFRAAAQSWPRTVGRAPPAGS